MYKIHEEPYKHELLGCKLTMNSGECRHIDNIVGHGFSNDTGAMTYMFRTQDGVITHLPHNSFKVNEWIHTGRYEDRVRKVITIKGEQT
jgi:hypothetical protein